MRERISELYRRIHFPSRFRSQFAEWIEAQNWYVSVKFIIMKRVINKTLTVCYFVCGVSRVMRQIPQIMCNAVGDYAPLPVVHKLCTSFSRLCVNHIWYWKIRNL